MLERNELARAMTELPDELLLEQERTARPTRIVKFRRIIAAAATIALLTVTVGAVSVGITWGVGKETRNGHGLDQSYYKDDDGSLDFEKLEWNAPLGVTELRPGNRMAVRDLLRRYWDLTQLEEYAQSHEISPEHPFLYDSDEVDDFMETFTGRYSISQSKEASFRDLEAVEQLLGIDLDVPDALREAIRGESEKGYSRVLGVRIKTAHTMEQVTEALGSAEPTEIVIYYQMNHYCMNGQVHGSIIIPLTAEEAQRGMGGLSYSYYEKEGPIWQEEQTIGGRTVTIFGNDPVEGYDGWCEAAFTSDGIGYTISARWEHDIPYYSDNWFHSDSAKEIVLSLFADGE